MRQWLVLWESSANNFERWGCTAANAIEAIERWEEDHPKRDVNDISQLIQVPM